MEEIDGDEDEYEVEYELEEGDYGEYDEGRFPRRGSVPDELF